jgi:hypothetical protein
MMARNDNDVASLANQSIFGIDLRFLHGAPSKHSLALLFDALRWSGTPASPHKGTQNKRERSRKRPGNFSIFLNAFRAPPNTYFQRTLRYHKAYIYLISEQLTQCPAARAGSRVTYCLFIPM